MHAETVTSAFYISDKDVLLLSMESQKIDPAKKLHRLEKLVRSEIPQNSKVGEEIHTIIRELREAQTTSPRPNDSLNPFKHIYEKAPLGILYYNYKGVITACNDRFAEILGTSKEKLLGLNINKLPNRELVGEVEKSLLGKKGLYEGQYKSVTSGKTVPVRATFHPVEGSDSESGGGIGMVEDITEKHTVGKKLLESESRFHSFFQNEYSVILLIDPANGSIIDANRAAENFYSRPIDRLKEMNINEINTYSYDEIEQEITLAQQEKRSVYRFEHRLADGSTRNVETYNGLIEIDGKQRIYSIIRDITEEVKAKRELKKFKLGIERSSNIVFITDKDGFIRYINPRFTEVYGYDKQDIEGQTPRILKSGKIDQKFYKKFWDDILSGNVIQGELINRTKDGTLIDIYSTSNPIIDDDGDLLGFIAIQEDITKKKQMTKRLEASLKEKEVLLAEIHHRVKNNLAITSGLLELNLYSSEKHSIEEIIRSSQMRIKAMANIHEILYQSGTFSQVSFKTYIHDLIKTVKNTVEDEGFETEFITEIDDINLNINQAHPAGLIINELLTNSIRHGFPNRNRGAVEIKVYNNEDKINVSVEDDGIGVADSFDYRNSNTVGMTLIRTLAGQLGADISMGNSKKGFRCSITFDKVEKVRGASSSFVE